MDEGTFLVYRYNENLATYSLLAKILSLACAILLAGTVCREIPLVGSPIHAYFSGCIVYYPIKYNYNLFFIIKKMLTLS